MLGDKAADWVQAVGSIAAILGAWMIGSRQSRHERMLEADRRSAAADDHRRIIEKRDRRAIDAMMLTYDIVGNIADHLQRSTGEKPLDAAQMKRWLANADDYIAYHAVQHRDWGDLTLTLIAARRPLPAVFAALDAYDGSEGAREALKASLDRAFRDLRSNINHLEPDVDYVPFHPGLEPKQMPAWPRGDATPVPRRGT
ncbi:hypothetical protein [Caulobacter rhizosphaerae]|uniref:hypothetical protein n=1 Tax=Caulobacter rhizosphaerae TaxID=2010972 RepID=UPI0013D7E55B|nr:hypothetical protein [Caulobacter rhizosphaerae]GGL29180.1 hypothetical protein GCM10010983_28120 [Caulobacter rhizosphaerae]